MRDWSGAHQSGLVYQDITISSDGVTMDNDLSYIRYKDIVSGYGDDEVTVMVEADWSSVPPAGTQYLYYNGSNLRLSTNGSSISGSGFFISNALTGNNSQIAMVYKNNQYPRIYVDGVYVGSGTSKPSTSTSRTSFYIGNDSNGYNKITTTIKKIIVCDSALTDDEIKALYDQRYKYGEANNMAMNRSLVTATGTTGAISVTVDGGDDFDLMYISIKFDSAPTSAGNITVSLDAETGSNYDAVWQTINPVGSTSVKIDKIEGLQHGDKMLIEYANPDNRNYYIQAVYQL